MKSVIFASIATIFLCSPALSQSLNQIPNKTQKSHLRATTSINQAKSNSLLDSQNIVIGIVSGIVSSSIASGVFLLLLASLRPKIEISDKIAKDFEKKTDENGAEADVPVYRVKVINKTCRRIIHVKLNFKILEPSFLSPPQNQPKRRPVNKDTRTLKLLIPEVTMVEKLPLFFPNKDDDGDFACTFRCYEEIENLWEKTRHEAYLEFTVFATDSLSNFTSTKTMRYYKDRQPIMVGRFEHGNNMTIKPLPGIPLEQTHPVIKSRQ